MKRTIQEIAEYVGGELRGDRSVVLDSIASLKNAGPTDLSYAEERFHDEVAHSRAGCVIVRSGEFPSQNVIVARNPKLAFARAAEWLLTETRDDAGIHPSATVAPDAEIGEGVKIGAGAVIEGAASIGARTAIEAGCFVGKKTRVGSNFMLYPPVVIYRDVEI